MNALTTAILAVIIGASGSASPTTTALGLAVLEAVLDDVGVGPNAVQQPRATGPVLLDRESFESAYTWTFDSVAAAELTDTLIAEGYEFASLDTLVQTASDSAGRTEYWLPADAILVHLNGITRYGNSAEAHIAYVYTYEDAIGRAVCPRTIKIYLRQTGIAEWATDEIRRVSDC